MNLKHIEKAIHEVIETLKLLIILAHNMSISH